MLFVKKKDGSLRVCIDYRQLKKVTTEKKYRRFNLPTPMRNLRVREVDIPKKDFRTRSGIRIDPRKTKAVKRLATPFRCTDIQSFLGLTRKVISYAFRQLKEYEMSVIYHPDIANIVADSLSRMSIGNIAHVEDRNKELVKDVHRLAWLGVRLEDSPKGGFMVGKVSYEFKLPSELALVHPVLHVFMFKKCIGDPIYIIPIIGLDEKFSYEDGTVEILEHQVKKITNKEVASVKVLWINHQEKRRRPRPT
ncbi:hypothetical protein EJD97_023069 [Solanum chilense]|uniref:Reverse transcriptase RNase H-like domain-containing protein n=1 Tax=Solanum chilense TaxID=4083 RepID=A0A6N2C2S3_SOLCI|nr:hypothetical protein EJD97_023069 [Solanum chilense]